MITVQEYTPDLFNEVLRYCKRQHNDVDAAASNMWCKKWQQSSETLLYILLKNDRFAGEKGKFFLLREDDEIIGCGGAYISSFSEKVAFLGVRTWISKEYRSMQLVKDYLLVAQKKWAIGIGIETLAISFNAYNKNLRKLFLRGQAIGTRTEDHLFYKNCNVLDYLTVIQNVPQYVMYENMTDYTFDWETLKE